MESRDCCKLLLSGLTQRSCLRRSANLCAGHTGPRHAGDDTLGSTVDMLVVSGCKKTDPMVLPRGAFEAQSFSALRIVVEKKRD